MRYRFTNRARGQLDQITYYISLDKPSAADSVFEHVLETCQTISEMPGIGKNPIYIADKTILCIPVKKYKNYLVYYRKRQKEVIILSVIDGRQNLPSLFS